LLGYPFSNLIDSLVDIQGDHPKIEINVPKGIKNPVILGVEIFDWRIAIPGYSDYPFYVLITRIRPED